MDTGSARAHRTEDSVNLCCMITKNGKSSGRKFGHEVSEGTRKLIAQATRRYEVDEHFFTSIDTEAKAYILGFAATDGHIDDGLFWTLQASDAPILEKIKLEMLSAHPIKFMKMTNSGGTITEGAKLSIYSKNIVTDLEKLGFLANKTKTIKPWNGPEELMPHYWRGCIDGDGWVSETSSKGFRVGFCGNLQMVEGFRDFIDQKTGRHGNIRPIKSIFRVEYSGVRPPKVIIEALKYASASICLPRKLDIASQILVREPKRKSYSHLTPEILNDLYKIHKQWSGVAKELKMKFEDLYRVRKRLQMPMSKARNWTNKKKI